MTPASLWSGKQGGPCPRANAGSKVCVVGFVFILLVYLFYKTQLGLLRTLGREAATLRGLLTSQRCEGKVGLFIETLKSTLMRVSQCGA